MKKNFVLVLILFSFTSISCNENSLDIKPDFSHRTYELYIPNSLKNNTDPSVKPPLLVVLHGFGGKGLSMKNAIGMDKLAEQNDFIVVYPNGYQARWDLALDCNNGAIHEEDEFAFIEYLIDYFISEYNVDENKIFAAGFSNGAIFSMAMPTKLPGRFKGIISASGQLIQEVAQKLSSTPPVSVMMINGTADYSIPWDPQETGQCGLLSAENSIAVWRNINRCDDDPDIKYFEDKGNQYISVSMESYFADDNETETSLVKVEGGGHYWYMYEEFNSSVEIVKFMKRNDAFD